MRRAAVCVVFAVALGSTPAAGQNDQWTSAYWEKHRLPGGFSGADRAESVFAVLLRVAEKLEQRRPHLILVDAPDDRPLALSLPDGGVVVSREALDLCYRDVRPEAGDARAAFVMGHELAHLASDHFWHVAAYFSVRDLPDAQTRNRLGEALALTPKETQERELLADGKGLIYLTVAGFDPQAVLGDADFFARWTALPPRDAAFGADHPTPADRTAFLQSWVEPIVKKLPFFEWGTRFHQIGDYDAAIDLLTGFKSVFAGPATLNNLALSHFQRGLRRAMRTCPEAAMQIRLPLLTIDAKTLADRFTFRGKGEDCLKNDSDLKESVRLLEIASPLGPLQAKLNHCAALTMARSAAEAYLCGRDLLESRPTADAELLDALALYLLSLEDQRVKSEVALSALKELAERYDRSAEIAYNRASVVDNLEGAAAAEPLWRRFLELEPDGEYARHARQRLGESASQRQDPLGSVGSPPASPVPLGPVGAEARRWLGESKAEEVFEAAGSLWRVHRRDEIRVLYLLPENGRTGEIVMIETPDRRAKTQITARFGPPRQVVASVAGEFLRYAGFGFDVRDGASQRLVFFRPQ